MKIMHPYKFIPGVEGVLFDGVKCSSQRGIDRRLIRYSKVESYGYLAGDGMTGPVIYE